MAPKQEMILGLLYFLRRSTGEYLHVGWDAISPGKQRSRPKSMLIGMLWFKDARKETEYCPPQSHVMLARHLLPHLYLYCFKLSLSFWRCFSLVHHFQSPVTITPALNGIAASIDTYSFSSLNQHYGRPTYSFIVTLLGVPLNAVVSRITAFSQLSRSSCGRASRATPDRWNLRGCA